MKKLFLILALIIAMAGCRDYPIGPGEGGGGGNNDSNRTRINFSQLQVGQRSTYLYYIGENYDNPNNLAFHYYADTLYVEVTGTSGSGYTFREYLSPGSRSMHNNGNMNGNGNMMNMADTATYTYNVRVSADSIYFFTNGGSPLRSHFNFNGRGANEDNYSLPAMNLTNRYIHILGWKPEPGEPVQYRTGYIENYMVLGHTYPRLNVVVDNTVFIGGRTGKTYVYSASDGIVHSATYGVWFNNGNGWDLMY